MFATTSPSHTDAVPDYLANVAYSYGDRLANSICDWLDHHGRLVQKGQRPAPRAYLFELGAVLQLALWEAAGLRRHLTADLPTFEQARLQLQSRARLGASEFLGSDAAPLFAAVFRAWILHFAWDGHKQLGADVVVREVDEDLLIETLATQLWQHRAELINLLHNDREQR